MLTFKSPNGLYKLEYPGDYHLNYEIDILSISPPKNNSCLTISSHQFEHGISDFEFGTLFHNLTLKYEAIQNPIFLSEDVILQRLKNVRPNREGDIVTTFWTICLCRKRYDLLVISVNVPGEEDQEVFNEYERMLNSISM